MQAYIAALKAKYKSITWTESTYDSIFVTDFQRLKDCVSFNDVKDFTGKYDGYTQLWNMIVADVKQKKFELYRDPGAFGTTPETVRQWMQDKLDSFDRMFKKMASEGMVVNPPTGGVGSNADIWQAIDRLATLTAQLHASIH
jgi:hypothetical protein